MKRSLRPLAVLGVLLLAVGALLPPWDVCWHVDGSTCVNPGPAACCDEGESAPSAPEPCSDCADVANVVALKSEDQPLAPALSDSSVLIQSPTITRHFAPETPATTLAVHAPPAFVPCGLRSPPLRC